MATLSTGGTTSATLVLDAFASIAIVCDASCKGTMTFTSAAPNLKSNYTLNLRNQTFGPFPVPGTVTLAVTSGSATYTVTGATGGFSYDASGNITGMATILGLVADSTSAATANSTLIASALAAGGNQQLPPGRFYVNPDVLKATRQGTLRGAGANNGAYFWSTSQSGNLAEQAFATCLATTSRTGWILGIDCSGFSVEDIHFQNEAAVNGAGIPTAGGGVRIGSLLATTGIASSQANSAKITKCSFYGCYRSIDHYSSDSYVIAENVINNWVVDGIRINNVYNPSAGIVSDYGDPIIMGNQITAGLYSAATQGIHFLSGGGVKIVGNKINGNGLGSATYYLKYGIFFDIPTTTNTSVFVITGNSIEGITGATGACLAVIYQNTTGAISYMTITGNEFQTDGTAGGILLQGIASGNLVGRVTIGANVFNNCCANGGINLSYCQAINILPNVFGNMAASQYAITMGEVVAGSTFHEQTCESTSWTAAQFLGQINDTSSSSAINPAGGFERNTFHTKYSQTVNFATKQAGAANFIFLGPSKQAKAGMRIKVVVEGQMAGLNANLFYTGERALIQTFAAACVMFPVNNAATGAQPLFDQVAVDGVAVGSIVSGTNTTTNSIVTIASGAEAATSGLNIQWLILDGTGIYIRLYHTSGSAAGATNAFRGTIHVEAMGSVGVVQRYRQF